MSAATDGFPNYFIYLGPNSGLGTENLLVLIEKMADYFTEVVAGFREITMLLSTPNGKVCEPLLAIVTSTLRGRCLP